MIQQQQNHRRRVAQSVTCLTAETCLGGDPGVASLMSAWSHTFVEIDLEIISTVILLPSADLSVTIKVCARSTG